MSYLKLIHLLFAISNLILQLNGQQDPVGLQPDGPQAVFKKEYRLECQVSNSNEYAKSVQWYKDGKPIKDEKPGHYVVKTDGGKSILLIKSFVEADTNITLWESRINSGDEQKKLCEFKKIDIIATPQGMQTDRLNEMLDSEKNSIRLSERESIKFSCVIQPNVLDLNSVKWQFSIDQTLFGDLPEGVVSNGNEMHIKNVQKIHRGYYQCTFNDKSYIALIRVKDRLAPLWPFIGIVTTVIILVIVIFIFEKQQKARKKATATDDDDQDQANDPLVRTPTKTPDNDTKKREVKA